MVAALVQPMHGVVEVCGYTSLVDTRSTCGLIATTFVCDIHSVILFQIADMVGFPVEVRSTGDYVTCTRIEVLA